MTYKIILPNKSEMKFEDKDGAMRAAKENATKMNKVISVHLEKDGEWIQIALVYPNGFVQEGTGGFGFFKNLPVGRRR
jgi:hypothetical protein